MPLDEAIRQHKRLDLYRHPLICAGELFDPFEPDVPFFRVDLLPVMEREWHFRRAAIPDYMKIWTGKTARERIIRGIREEYELSPAERFRRIKGVAQGALYKGSDPETWDEEYEFMCLFPIPPSLGGNFWFGGRCEALANPKLRPILLDLEIKVLHGAEAVRTIRKLRAGDMDFGKFSDEMIGPILSKKTPDEQRTLLALMRQLTPLGSEAHNWIDKKLEALK